MLRRSFVQCTKVAVIGAAGGVGQPLVMLLKNNPLVDQLSLFDIKGVAGVVTDAAQIPSPAKVSGYKGPCPRKALANADIVVVVAGMHRQPRMRRHDLFNANVHIIRHYIRCIGEVCPNAIVGFITDPINSLIPTAAETLKQMNCYNKNKLFGINNIDLVRARTIVAHALQRSSYEVNVPVIGGHSSTTIVPVLSQFPELTDEVAEYLTRRIRSAGDEVVEAKAGAGAATLSTASATAEWCFSMLRALRGDDGVVEYAFAESDVCPEVNFFCGPVRVGKDGIVERLPLPELNPREKELLEHALPIMKASIQQGIDYVKEMETEGSDDIDDEGDANENENDTNGENDDDKNNYNNQHKKLSKSNANSGEMQFQKKFIRAKSKI